MDIKESKELLAGLEVLAVAGAKIAKDKKLGIDDLAPAFEALKQYQVILDAFHGVDQVPAEVKDIDSVEAAQLGYAVVEILKKVKAELAVVAV